MVEMRFYISGSLVAEARQDDLPAPGSEVTIRTESYKKGVVPGSLIRFTYEGDYCEPTSFDTGPTGMIANVDVNAWEVLEEGPPLSE